MIFKLRNVKISNLKLLKKVLIFICLELTNILIISFQNGLFPERLNMSRVASIFLKKNSLVKKIAHM